MNTNASLYYEYFHGASKPHLNYSNSDFSKLLSPPSHFFGGKNSRSVCHSYPPGFRITAGNLGSITHVFLFFSFSDYKLFNKNVCQVKIWWGEISDAGGWGRQCGIHHSGCECWQAFVYASIMCKAVCSSRQIILYDVNSLKHFFALLQVFLGGESWTQEVAPDGLPVFGSLQYDDDHYGFHPGRRDPYLWNSPLLYYRFL